MIGVIAPMAAEYRTARILGRAGCRVLHGGVGLARAERAAEALLEAGAERLLVWGTAGGLKEYLRPGSLLLPESVKSPDGERYGLDAAWRHSLAARLPVEIPVVEAPLVSVARPVATLEAKRILARESGAVAVDMETAAVARVAARHGVPCAVIRAVADPLELPLPSVVLAARTDRLLPLEIPARLLLRPRDARSLFALGRAFADARATLSQSAVALADSLREAVQG
ncbi:MAG TPA: purine phosphorylase [Gammaproteobacteria bacterium]|nr:purine phosphorylase [Gammaproteobacteria bacterium]